MRLAFCVALTAAAWGTATPASGQERRSEGDTRSVEIARTLRDSVPGHVQISFSGGRLSVGAAEAPYLYRIRARERGVRARPLHRYDPTTRTLRIGAGDDGGREVRWGAGAPRDFSLGVAGAVPVDMTAQLRAAASLFDLAMVPITELDVDATLSAVKIVLGDSGAPLATDVRVHGVMSAILITLPRDVGLQVDLRTTAGGESLDFPHPGGTYESPNWRTSHRKVRLSVRTLLSKLRIERVGAAD